MDRKHRRLLRRAAQANALRLKQEAKAETLRFWADVKARGLSEQQARAELFRSVYGGAWSAPVSQNEWPALRWEKGEEPGRLLSEPHSFAAHVSVVAVMAGNASQKRIARAARDVAHAAQAAAHGSGLAVIMPTARITAGRNEHGLLEIEAFALTAKASP